MFRLATARSSTGMRAGATLLAGLLLGSLGCDVTPEQIAKWKETERGPKKLREALGRAQVAPPLRAQALCALVELGMTGEALADLGQLPDSERTQIVHEAVPRLGVLSGIGAAAGDVTTTRVQRDAKDALFLLRASATEADRVAIDDLLIAWTTADLGGRMTAGGQGTEKILPAIGVRAAPRLIELLKPGSPELVPAARLLGQIADEPTRARAVDALVQVAHHERQASDATMQAIGLLGGPRATQFLVESAEHGAEVVRTRALLSLAQGSHPGAQATSTALRVAADGHAAPKVREAGFQLAEKIGLPAVPGLVRLMGDKSEIVRWRAVEAALAAGKAQAVEPVLEALSPERSYKKDDLASYVVHDLGLVGKPAVVPLKHELGSKNWVARTVAVEALAQLGQPDDAKALEPLVRDGTKLKGFPGGATVGGEAKAAVAALRAKR